MKSILAAARHTATIDAHYGRIVPDRPTSVGHDINDFFGRVL
jgi:hypothetical protein